MKILLKTFFLMAVFSLVAGCDRTDDLEFDNASLSNNDFKKNINMGFNLVFTGTYDLTAPDLDKCGSFPPMINVINNGEGTGTHFGKLTSHFDFCVDVRDSSYPNAFEEAYFEDENGDRLYVYVEGFVLPGRVPGMPNFANSYFKDPFVITGGTGRFEGATGSGMTNDYNSSKDPFSHHHWKGKITLLKGN
ncbi:MAG: hypothetical protein KAJ28_09875 [Flavobacteriaceae bacterium]|nr:hypothetical protein [Flavobacteriaceae bacterium]